MFTNLSPVILIEHAIKGNSAQGIAPATLSATGALCVETGTFTGRAAQDKYVVESTETQENVFWGKDTKKMDKATFTQIKMDVLNYLEEIRPLYKNIQVVGPKAPYQLDVELITPSASHALFAHYLFRTKTQNTPADLGRFTIYHAPGLTVDPAKYNTRSGTVIVTSFEERTILIIGTFYAGEIKKSIFSVMNYILPNYKVLPMHAGASVHDKTKSISVFFGLSGTGKTTLSTDIGTHLIGDDEHGLTDDLLFNFEGGCYAKTLGLTSANEPDIYNALSTFGALLENVVLDPQTHQPDFSKNTLSENGRGSYPLHFIKERIVEGYTNKPNNFFFLSADAFGVLPPVSLLTPSQAMYYFLSGYTAKVAGTEMGVTKPTAAFSMCFGAPFMLRHPQVYGELLGSFLKKHNTPVWLINTGWTKGPAGVGERFSLKITREVIRSIQSGNIPTKLNNQDFQQDPILGLYTPKAMDSLHPINTWSNKEAYTKSAKELAGMFHANFKKFTNVSKEILEGGPIYQG